jgi:hypothetical protein
LSQVREIVNTHGLHPLQASAQASGIGDGLARQSSTTAHASALAVNAEPADTVVAIPADQAAAEDEFDVLSLLACAAST